jgi:hypothetical protein
MRFSLLKYAALFPCLALCQVSVPTYRYNNSRSGANMNETVLTPTIVQTHFGKLFSIPVTGEVYAQPLYIANVAIAGQGMHNVLYVATMEDIVYAFDADNGALLWSRNFTNPPAVIPVPILDITNGNNVTGDVGIESTPVIDMPSNTIYLVARTKESGQYFQRLHALDITSGAEKPNSPATITATAIGKGTTSVAGIITFDPLIHNQRAGLALASNRVFVAWASHGDQYQYHGWIMAYDMHTLGRLAAVLVTPNGAQGGIWQSGWAPAVDASGNVFYASGNGDWDGIRNFGESVLKYSSLKIAAVDYFSPDNNSFLTGSDEDLGGSGPMLLPGTNFVTIGGKQGLLYLLNANNLGHFSAGNANALQVITTNGQLLGGPAFWSRSTNPTLYVQAEQDFLKAYQLSGSTLTKVAQGDNASPLRGGGALTVSANSSGGNGIVWAATTVNESAESSVVPGILRAYDANTLADLWNSEANSARDSLGNWAKFVPPVVVNGKVYMASFSGSISVYGQLP